MSERVERTKAARTKGAVYCTQKLHSPFHSPFQWKVCIPVEQLEAHVLHTVYANSGPWVSMASVPGHWVN